MDLPPGHYELRGAAHSARLGTGGSVFLPVEIPDFSTAALALTDLVVGYADGARVPTAPQVTVPPLLPFAPTLDRAFTRTDTLRVFTRIVGRPANAVFQATIVFTRADGTNAARYTQTLGDTNEIDARLPLAQLAPGGYTLEIGIASGTATAKKSIGMTVK